MTEVELDKACESNPNCDCQCANCPLMGKYWNTELNH